MEQISNVVSIFWHGFFGNNMDTTDQPNSICQVERIEMYPLKPVDPKLPMPFALLDGEAVDHYGNSVDGLIILTNYRLYLQVGQTHHHVPLGLVEVVEHKELFYLQIGCKDARTYRCSFDSNESCLEWYDKILKAAEPPKQLDQLFAFYHFEHYKENKDCISKDGLKDEVNNKDGFSRKKVQKQYAFDKDVFRHEMQRLEFEGHSWRISEVNINYKLCPTYPPYLLVPSCITDAILESVARFRSSRRIPAVVWRHKGNGAVLARCSQPEVGWLGWRSAEDEDLIKAISQACNFDITSKVCEGESNLSTSPGSIHSEEVLQISTGMNIQEKKVLIIDARSYTTAVANRARGGGCECPDYYPNCEIQFMNLANIHSIRKSFHSLRQLCMSSAEQNWHSQLEGTKWMLHMSGLMKAAVTLVKAIEMEARPVLVHCSDGWDRTPQIVALAELLLDPYYRTIDGFRILIEREWLAFGHKFADRCGHSTGSEDQNERCPVFLQWLDCVHQLVQQFTCAFEFSDVYLVKLAQHTYSNFFGTFLCNTLQERTKIVNGRTFSVWEFLNSPRFKNHLYDPFGVLLSKGVLWPQCNVRDLHLWKEVYLGTMEANFGTEGGSGACPGPPGSFPNHMTKTKSYNDLMNASDGSQSHFRRSSDPSINIDKKLNSLTTSDLTQETIPPSQDMINGIDIHPQLQPTLSNDLDDVGCNVDCIYKDTTQNLTDDQIDGLGQDMAPMKLDAAESSDDAPSVNDGRTAQDFLCQNVITPNYEVKTDGGDDAAGDKDVSENSCNIGDDSVRTNKGDINHNEDAESGADIRGVNGACDNGTMGSDIEKSVETSTETLVSESVFCGSSPKEINGFEKIRTPLESNDTTDSCNACAQNSKCTNGSHRPQFSDLPNPSRYSTSPLYSRTSSSNGWDSSLSNFRKHKTSQTQQYPLGDDGLIPLRSDIQERLLKIIEEHKRREEQLERELRTYKNALIQQICHRCNHNEAERLDDNNSIVESVGSAGEGQASAVESLRSDMSWENLNVEGSIYPECQSNTLWVPDHAVKRCTGCQTEFGLVRRKHHCRKCGRIFCADCSENSTPLPSEQLYNPVRVCTGCYAKLRRECGDITGCCKHGNPPPANNNPQITASSN